MPKIEHHFCNGDSIIVGNDAKTKSSKCLKPQRVAELGAGRRLKKRFVISPAEGARMEKPLATFVLHHFGAFMDRGDTGRE